MKTEHTPEPWFWSEKYGEVCFRSKEDDQSYGIACPVDLTEEANARRVSACVNACAGLPSEVLERYKLGVIGVDYKSTKQQRDELLAALERSLESFEYIAKYGNSCGHSQLRIPDLKAVIASVKEKQNAAD